MDDHVLLLDAIKKLLEPEFDVVGTFADGQSLLEAVSGLEPHVIVLDIGMPTLNGLSTAIHLKKLLPKVRLIFLTMNQDRDTAAEAFRIGAAGYVLKTAAASELVQALREVIRGAYYASPSLTEGMVGSFVQNFKNMNAPHEITPRQKEVLQSLTEGLSMKEIARSMDITPRTVAFHKYTMMEQLGIESTAELIAFGIKNSLIHR